jgi:hypothetical protein
MRVVVVVLGLVLALFVPPGSAAKAEVHVDPAQDPKVAWLLQAKGATLAWNLVPPGKTARYGHAEVLVDAPLARVRAVATDFAHYRDFYRKFASARVIAKAAGNVDVYTSSTDYATRHRETITPSPRSPALRATPSEARLCEVMR